MGKRLTACLLALCLAASLLCSVSAKEPEISLEIDQTGQDSAAAVITLAIRPGVRVPQFSKARFYTHAGAAAQFPR